MAREAELRGERVTLTDFSMGGNAYDSHHVFDDAEEKIWRHELAALGQKFADEGNTDMALKVSQELAALTESDAKAAQHKADFEKVQEGWSKAEEATNAELREGWIQREYVAETRQGMRGRDAGDIKAAVEARYDKYHGDAA
jgi:hypothetical protein